MVPPPPVKYISPPPDDQIRMTSPLSPLDFCIYLKRCEVQCSIYEDLSREIDLYHPDYYRYWARLKVQICATLEPPADSR
jgi:hypothetical protein